MKTKQVLTDRPCARAHTHTHTRRHPHAHTHTHTHTHARTHARTHAHTHPRMHARAHARTHAPTHARARAHARAHTHARTHVRTHAHAHMHARTHARTHTHTHTYRHPHTRAYWLYWLTIRTDYTKLNLHSSKRAANRDLRRMKTAARNGKHGRSVVLGKEMFSCYTLNESRERFLSERKRKHLMCLDLVLER